MSAKDFVIPPGEGAVWHMAPGRSATLKITSDIAQSVMMFEEVAPTDTVTNLHIHHGSDEVAYVLSGEVTFMIGDQVTVGGAGTCAFMPRGLPHAWKSTGSEPGRILFLYTPGNAGGAFEEAVRMNRPISSLSQQEAAERRQRHGSETVGPPPF
jgi:mannose-6-phosphate isomerase-like protein (cupin superfamily)